MESTRKMVANGGDGAIGVLELDLVQGRDNTLGVEPKEKRLDGWTTESICIGSQFIASY